MSIKKIILHTGNILDNEELVRKVGKTTLEEDKNTNEILEIRGTERITNGVSMIDGSLPLDGMKNELCMDKLHTVIIIPPDVSDDVPLDDLKPVWEALEVAVSDGEVGSIGVADLSPQLFKELYEWAEVKPAIIQVNLSSCCSVSEDLTLFAAQKDVQVLTHNDDPEVVDEDIIATILSRVELNGANCELSWLTRHRVIQTCYGLILLNILNFRRT
ncbi:Glutamate--cysteine ligase regulatory subunit, partial [Armadillidium nasatum]